MGTYSDESPDASIGERLANSVKKIGQAIVGTPKATPTMGAANPSNAEAESAAGEENYASNTGRSGQSTDAYNKY